jgi:hypothetical protein
VPTIEFVLRILDPKNTSHARDPVRGNGMASQGSIPRVFYGGAFVSGTVPNATTSLVHTVVTL